MLLPPKMKNLKVKIRWVKVMLNCLENMYHIALDIINVFKNLLNWIVINKICCVVSYICSLKIMASMVDRRQSKYE